MGDKAKGTPLMFAILGWRRLMIKIKQNKRTQWQAIAAFIVVSIMCIYCLNSQISDELNTLLSQGVPFNQSVSMVYLYCNGSDPDYLDRREKAGLFVEEHDDSVYGMVPNKLEFSPQNDRGELKLSLRALDKYAPWIRHVYVVSDAGTVPVWMDTSSSRITVIDSNKLVLDCLEYYSKKFAIDLSTDHLAEFGSFNSHSMYLCLHTIPGIDDIFIESDDDFILTKALDPKDIVDMKTGECINWVHDCPGCHPRINLPVAQRLVDEICADRDYDKLHWALHTIRTWDRRRVEEIWESFPKETLYTVNHLFRSESDIDLTSFYPIYQHCKHNVAIHGARNSESAIGVKHETQSVNFEQILKQNKRKTINVQDEMKQWDHAYWPLNIRKLYIELPQYLNLTKRSEFERPATDNMLKTKIMANLESFFPYFLTEDVANKQYVKCSISLNEEDVIVIHHSETATSSLEKLLLWTKEQQEVHLQMELKEDTDHPVTEICNESDNFESEAYLNKLHSESDLLINQLVALLKKVDYPVQRLQISSSKGPRLANARRQMIEFGQDTEGMGFALITRTVRDERLSSDESECLLESILHWKATDISISNMVVTQEFIEMCEMQGVHVQIEMDAINQGDGRQLIFDALMFNPDVLCTNQPILAKQIIEDIQSQNPLFQFKNAERAEEDEVDERVY